MCKFIIFLLLFRVDRHILTGTKIIVLVVLTRNQFLQVQYQ